MSDFKLLEGTDPLTLMSEIDSLKAEELDALATRAQIAAQLTALDIHIAALEGRRLVLERRNLLANRGITHCPPTKTPRNQQVVTLRSAKTRASKPQANIATLIRQATPEQLDRLMTQRFGPNWRSQLLEPVAACPEVGE